MKVVWVHFDHDADIGVRGYGYSQNEAVEQAVFALTAIITEPTLVRPLHPMQINCEAPDLEFLLAVYINRAVFMYTN